MSSYMKNLVAHWRMDAVNPQDVAWPGETLRDGLVAQWKCNDNAATTTVVESINGITLTAARNTNLLTIAGKVNTALDFNSAGDFLSLGAADARISPGGNISVAAWVYCDDTSARRAIANTKADSWGTGWQLGMSAGGIIRFDFNETGSSANYLDSGAAIPAAAWTHVVAVHAGNMVYIYIDGALSSSGVRSALTAAAGALVVGRYQTTGVYYWDGRLDDIRIYNRALSQSDISALYVNGYGTEAYGRTHITTATNMDATNIVSGIAGGKALTFNGTDEQMTSSSYAYSYDLAPRLNSFAVSVWIKPQLAATAQRLCGKEGGTGYWWVQLTAANRFSVNMADGVGSLSVVSDAAYSYSVDRWFHFLASIDRSTNLVYLFVNGEQACAAASCAGVGSMNIYGSVFQIASFSGANRFNGAIDNIMVFNGGSAITLNQARDLYERQRRGQI